MADKIKAVIREVGKITAAVGGRDTTPAKWRGKWQPEERYGTLHKVEHLGNSYVCIKACVGVDPEADVTLGDGVEGQCWILIAAKGKDGSDGQDGEAFTYDMFTEEQLEALRGPEGPRGERGAQGERGERGAAFTYDMFTEEQLEALRGAQGIQGVQGQPGEDGKSGVYVGSGEMPEGYYIQIDPSGDESGGYPGTGGDGSGENGVTFYPHVDANGNLSWTNNGGLTNPSTVNIRGPEGQPGQKGDTGEPGQTGEDGAAGKDATINGVNALTISGNGGVAVSQSGSQLNLSVEGTFAGQVVANSSGQTYSTYLLRNTRLASSDTNPTVNGQICWTYG